MPDAVNILLRESLMSAQANKAPEMSPLAAGAGKGGRRSTQGKERWPYSAAFGLGQGRKQHRRRSGRVQKMFVRLNIVTCEFSKSKFGSQLKP